MNKMLLLTSQKEDAEIQHIICESAAGKLVTAMTQVSGKDDGQYISQGL